MRNMLEVLVQLNHLYSFALFYVPTCPFLLVSYDFRFKGFLSVRAVVVSLYYDYFYK